VINKMLLRERKKEKIFFFALFTNILIVFHLGPIE